MGGIAPESHPNQLLPFSLQSRSSSLRRKFLPFWHLARLLLMTKIRRGMAYRDMVRTRPSHNELTMPPIGFGTWQVSGRQCTDAVRAAIETGFRLIDTAAIYRNEEAVAAALASSPVPRNELYITTKLSPQDTVTPERVVEAFHQSLQRLGLTYVDCYMVHWPGSSGLQKEDPLNGRRRLATWAAMCSLQQRGLVRHLAVSNFTVAHLEALPTPPSLIQLELHPLCQQRATVEYCRAKGITIQAYSPLGIGSLLRHPAVSALAAQLRATPSQALLLWSLEQGFVPLTRSTSSQHIAENFGALRLFWSSRGGGRRTQALDELPSENPSGNEEHHYCWDPRGVF